MSLGVGVETSASPKELGAAAAARFSDEARRAVQARGVFRVALSGGSTPKGMLTALAAAPVAARVPWRDVRVFWSDERCVPPDDAASNYKMADDALLSRVAIPPSAVVRMRGELDPQTGAAEYRARLAAEFGDQQPRFDLLFLGLGSDGHTASLFPHTAALAEHARSCVANRVDAGVASPWRLTLTFPAINAARAVAFLVDGREKATVLARVLRGERDVASYPAQGVAPADGTVTWYVDAAAASELT